ncbi:MAG TPA: hypothetical protein VIZ70_07610 [Propionibacteriaceae bacterium]
MSPSRTAARRREPLTLLVRMLLDQQVPGKPHSPLPRIDGPADPGALPARRRHLRRPGRTVVDGGRPDPIKVARRLQALLADLPRAARGDYGVEGSRRSMADVTDAASLAEVRAFKRESKAAARATGLTLGSLRFLDSGTGIP